MNPDVTPVVEPALVLEMVRYSLYALVVVAVTLGAVTIAIVRYGNNDLKVAIAPVFNVNETSKIVTVILIIFSATFLSMFGMIKGDAIVAILSGIAGYILGNKAAPVS